MFISAVQHRESAIYIYTSPPSEASLPPLQVITEHWVERPMWYSSFRLAGYFTHGSAYKGLPSWLKQYRICLHYRRPGSDPESGRSPGGGNGYPLQYSCLENSMDSPWEHKDLDTTEWTTLSVNRHQRYSLNPSHPLLPHRVPKLVLYSSISIPVLQISSSGPFF